MHEEINNSLEGFISYFTAPNIRNKVKHPLYLAYKFDQCVKLYYNLDKYENRQPESIILKTIDILLNFGKNSQNSNKITKSNNFMDKFNSQAYVTLLVSSADNNVARNKKVRKIKLSTFSARQSDFTLSPGHFSFLSFFTLFLFFLRRRYLFLGFVAQHISACCSYLREVFFLDRIKLSYLLSCRID